MKLRNVIFYVKDIGLSLDFYKKLGFQINQINQNFGKFISFTTDDKNTFFSIMESNDPEKVPGKQVCTFWAKNIESLYKNFQELDAEITTELYTAPFGKVFIIKDPDGNKIEFVDQEDS